MSGRAHGYFPRELCQARISLLFIDVTWKLRSHVHGNAKFKMSEESTFHVNFKNDKQFSTEYAGLHYRPLQAMLQKKIFFVIKNKFRTI